MVRPACYTLRTKEVKKNCLNHIHSITESDGLYDVKIEKHVESRTKAQQGFWHVLLKLYAEYHQVTPAQMKTEVKKRILGEDEYEINGVKKTREYSSEEEKKFQYSNLIECTYVLAAEDGCVLPDARPK